MRPLPFAISSAPAGPRRGRPTPTLSAEGILRNRKPPRHWPPPLAPLKADFFASPLKLIPSPFPWQRSHAFHSPRCWFTPGHVAPCSSPRPFRPVHTAAPVPNPPNPIPVHTPDSPPGSCSHDRVPVSALFSLRFPRGGPASCPVHTGSPPLERGQPRDVAFVCGSRAPWLTAHQRVQ